MNWKVLTGLCTLVMGLGGCADTQQVKGSDIKTGFLANSYSKLKPGKEGEANLVYMNPQAKWGSYDKIMLEAVSVWLGKGAEAEDHGVIPPEDVKRLANTLHSKLSDQLSKDYTLVQSSGPGVMRISVALTDVEHGMPFFDTVSTVMPPMRLMSQAKKLGTGVHTMVGKASVEARLVDSRSGKLLAAGVDQRAGGKKWGKGYGTWKDVENIFDYWSAKLRWRLCQQRRGTNCGEAPKE